MVFHGSERCCGTTKDGKGKCTNGGYHVAVATKKIYCGVHIKKQGRYKTLPKDKKAKKKKEESISVRRADAKRDAQIRKGRGDAGRVSAKKMSRYRATPDPGFEAVFPNNRHQNRKDGIGCCSLSPMRTGPVRHTQYMLPPCTLVENMHQGNKVFPQEMVEGEQCNCPRSAEWPHLEANFVFMTKRREMYRDSEPHRHKYPKKEIISANKAFVTGKKRSRGELVNAPMYSEWLLPDGRPLHITYVESRWYYCHYLSEGIRDKADMVMLRRRLANGWNLQIMGYDAYTPDALDAETLYRHYEDPSRPFGHEMVIMTMLALQDESVWPWNVYHAKHRQIYDGSLWLKQETEEMEELRKKMLREEEENE